MKSFWKGVLLGFITNICFVLYIIVFWGTEKELNPQKPKIITSFILGCILGMVLQFTIVTGISILIGLR